MTNYDGVENDPLTVRGPVALSGVAAGGVSVETGGTLRASGVISVPPLVRTAGRVAVSGVISGSVEVEAGGELDLTGVLNGPAVQNDGELTAAVGSVIHGRRISIDGTLESTTSDPVEITSSAGPHFVFSVLGAI